MSPTLQIARVAPDINFSPGKSYVDDLGVPYTVEINSPDLTIMEWTTFADPNDYFSIAGEVYLAPDAEPVRDILTVARFFDSSDDLIAVEEIVNVSYRLEPGGYNRIEHRVGLEPSIIDHYTVSFRVIR